MTDETAALVQQPPCRMLLLKADGPVVHYGISDRDDVAAEEGKSPFPVQLGHVRALEDALAHVAETTAAIRGEFRGSFWLTGAIALEKKARAVQLVGALNQAALELAEAAKLIGAHYPAMASIFNLAAERAAKAAKGE